VAAAAAVVVRFLARDTWAQMNGIETRLQAKAEGTRRGGARPKRGNKISFLGPDRN
jgi:hypothetical protein